MNGVAARTGVHGRGGRYVHDGVEGADVQAGSEVVDLGFGIAAVEVLDVARAGKVQDFEEAHGAGRVLSWAVDVEIEIRWR